ncbi:MAG: GSCFA domain-containing protein [Cytophagales bacterium]
MNFRTELQTSPFPFTINHSSKILSIGSCFADMVGDRLAKYKFKVLTNPFGNIFNPISVHKILRLKGDLALKSVENDGIWYNYDLHSEFNALSKLELEEKIKQKEQEVKLFLAGTTTTIIITYGTAWVYVLDESKSIVANCHKQPQNLFFKRLLTVEEIVECFQNLIESIPNSETINFILTVSPVRHIKDTLELNGVSKAVLRVACHHLASTFENVHYFPAFEMMQDDLRDYRFYKKDMIHPTEVAEDYIWDKFSNSIFDRETLQLLPKIEEVMTALNHKPFQPKSESYQNFIKVLVEKIELLPKNLTFENEIDFLKKLMNDNSSKL